MQDQFLNPPIQQLGYVDFIFRWTRDFVNPAELFRLASGAAENAEHLSVERELVYASGESVGTVEILCGSGCDADGPWCAVLRGGELRARLVAHPGVRV